MGSQTDEKGITHGISELNGKENSGQGAVVREKHKSKIPGVYYRDDGKPRWEVRIRWMKKGKSHELKAKNHWPVDPKAAKKSSFHWETQRKAAEAWATTERAALHATGKPFTQTADAWTFKALLERYLEDIEVGKVAHKSVKADKAGCRTMLGIATGRSYNKEGFPHLTKKMIGDLTYEDFYSDNSEDEFALSAMLKDRHGNLASHASLKRLLQVLRSVFKRAQKEWGIECENPLRSITGLTIQDERDRILDGDEWERMLSQLKSIREVTRDGLIFARYTAARRGEVVKLDWKDVNFRDKTALLRGTKSKGSLYRERTIPLPREAWRIIVRRAYGVVEPNNKIDWDKADPDVLDKKGISLGGNSALSGAIFSNTKGVRLRADALTQAWMKARNKAGLPDLRLHDLRHSRITELAEGKEFSAKEIASISGHTDLKTMFRYDNPKAKKLVGRIDAKDAVTKSPDAIKDIVEKLSGLTNEELAGVIANAMKRVSEK